MKVFSVVGFHHCGKTTAVENLIKYIKSQGQSISSIKDIHIEGFSMEKQGSNSHRHLLASNTCVFARGDCETYQIWNRQLTLKEMLNHINTDWCIIEGMKSVPLPKIIAAKNEDEINKLYDNTVFAITGLFSENNKSFNGIPCFNAMSDIEDLGSLVMEKVFRILPFASEGFCGHCGYNCQTLTAMILQKEKKRTDCGLKNTGKVVIKVNNEELVLNEWVQTLSKDLIVALCQNLKGYKPGDSIEIFVGENPS
jgi:molybdopterin-guanine dinucleotide biosynthesis protein B